MSKYPEELAELAAGSKSNLTELDSIKMVLAGLDLNVSESSFDSCEPQHLLHCYQLALDFGVPTAQRALAMYLSELTDTQVITKS